MLREKNEGVYMLEVSESQLMKYAMHYVGEATLFGEEYAQPNALLEATLTQLAFYKVDFEQQYEFFHATNLDLNEVYTYAMTIFEQPQSFYEESKHIATHLHTVSHHPNIKAGELFVGLFTNCYWHTDPVKALAIVKVEDKEMFLNVRNEQQKLEMDGVDGINVKKSANMVVIVQMPDGTPAVFMKTKKKEDVVYWQEHFLKLRHVDKNFVNTNMALVECKKYILKDENFSNTAKLDYLNKTLEFFRNEETFEVERYIESVFEKVDTVQKDVLMNTVKPFETEISETAIAKVEKTYKRKIKLDEHIEIQVNVRDVEKIADVIEVGFDEATNRKFYKIYFEEEQ